MFLSKLRLDIKNPSARQAIFNCNDMHRNLMQAFDIESGARDARMAAGLLYRLIERKDGYEILAMSHKTPNWQRLARNGYQAIDMRDISSLRMVLVRGVVLRFSLKAAPAKKIDSGGRNSRRVFLRTEEERGAWLMRQGEKYGFTISTFHEGTLPADVTGTKGGVKIRNRSADFSGLLTIADDSLFWKGYTQGIGSGKAYGLGMLLIARG